MKGPASKGGGYNITGAGQASPLQTVSQCRGDGGAEIGRGFDATNPGGAHGGVLLFRRALSAADDRTGMTHAASWRRGLTSDEADNGLLDIRLDELRGTLFGVAADFADQDDRMRIRVVIEQLNRIKEGRADDGIAADADAGGLSNAEARQLINGFVGQRSTPADDADIPLFVNPPGHDADFAFPRRDDAGTVRPDEASLFEIHGCGDAHHVH